MKHRRQLAFRISFRYALLIVFAFTLIYQSFYLILTRAMLRERADLLNQRLDVIIDGLDSRLDTVMSLQTDLLHDASLQQILKQEDPGADLSERLNHYRAGSYLFNAIWLFDPEAEMIARSGPETSGRESAELAGAVRTFAGTCAFRRFYMGADGRLYFLFALYPPESYSYTHFGAAEINRTRLLFDFSQDMTGTFAASRIFEEGDTVATVGAGHLFADYEPEGNQELSVFPERYIAFSALSSAYSPWRVTALYDQSRLQRAYGAHLRTLLLIFALTVLVALAIGILMARGIVLPVKDVLSSMTRLERGEYPPPLPVRREDEIGQLVRGYNHAVGRLEQLNRDVLAEQQEKRRLEVQSLQTKLDLLQTQINPHFIHNTMNTLNYMALRSGNGELSEVIASFNSLLRATLSTSSTFSTVEEELEYVRQYLLIQRHRYADRSIDCVFETEETAKKVKIPRLMLQPLVENALFHGILPDAERPGQIRIACTVRKEQLTVSVSDNGVGMSEEKLLEIIESGKPAGNGFNRIGLRNVRERLRLLYGEKCSFSIRSEKNQGTTVSFTVPAGGDRDVQDSDRG